MFQDVNQRNEVETSGHLGGTTDVQRFHSGNALDLLLVPGIQLCSAKRPARQGRAKRAEKCAITASHVEHVTAATDAPNES